MPAWSAVRLLNFRWRWRCTFDFFYMPSFDTIAFHLKQQHNDHYISKVKDCMLRYNIWVTERKCLRRITWLERKDKVSNDNDCVNEQTAMRRPRQLDHTGITCTLLQTKCCRRWCMNIAEEFATKSDLYIAFFHMQRRTYSMLRNPHIVNRTVSSFDANSSAIKYN